MKDTLLKRWHRAEEICSFGDELKDLLLKRWHRAGDICSFGGRMKDLLLRRWHCTGETCSFGDKRKDLLLKSGGMQEQAADLLQEQAGVGSIFAAGVSRNKQQGCWNTPEADLLQE